MYKIVKKDIIKKNKCPICNKSHYLKKISEVFYKNKFIFFSTCYCSCCSHIFRDKSPSQNWLLKKYNIRSKLKNRNFQINKKYEKFRNLRYKKISILFKNFNYQNLIDIGCATGEGTKVFRKKSVLLEGLDTDLTRLDCAKKNLDKIYTNSIESFNLKKNMI